MRSCAPVFAERDGLWPNSEAAASRLLRVGCFASTADLPRRRQLANKERDLALFNLALDSKLRGCDLVCLRVRDICLSGAIAHRAIVMQQKTHRPVQFEITEASRDALCAWTSHAQIGPGGYLFPGRAHDSHLSLRQYARIVKSWIACIGLDPRRYGTHSLRRTKATLIYRRTKNIRAISCSWAIRSWKAP
jgi:integrase